MTINIYGKARWHFARGLLDWQSDEMRAGLTRDDYLPLLNDDQYTSACGELLATTAVPNRSVSEIGWLLCDTVIFQTPPVNTDLSRIVVYRVLDGLLVFTLNFPTVNTSTVIPLAVIRSTTSVGLCRL